MPTIRTKFAEIPGGTFHMGSNHGPHPEDGEGPERQVALSRFAIAVTAVSNTEFAAFVSDTGYITTAERAGGSQVFQGQLSNPDQSPIVSSLAPWWRWVERANWRQPNGSDSALKNLPVVHVSREDALAFCLWSQTELPSEAQWERAAGSQAGIDPHIWQGEFPNRPEFRVGPVAVEDAPPNEFGLFHACGNVWEWTADRFARLHSPRLEKNPRGPLNGERYVVKGGSFLCSPSYCARFTPSSRRPENPDTTTSHLSFRVVKEI